MANIDSSLKNWSTTASSNQPDAADAATIQADLQQLQATVRQDLAYKGADISSAGTTDLGAVAGLMHDITGTTTITSFGTVSAGIWKIIKFEGALTLTHNATSLILPGGANITTADGDIAIVISEGSGNWRCVSYVTATGRPVINSFLDSQFQIKDNSDPTKILAFEASGITTGTIRTITVPDSSGTLPLIGLAQTFSALQTFSAGITLSGTASNINTGSNYISGDGTDTGLSFSGAAATFSSTVATGALTVTGTTKVEAPTSNGAISYGVRAWNPGSGSGTGSSIQLGFGDTTDSLIEISGYYDGSNRVIGFKPGTGASGAPSQNMTLSPSGLAVTGALSATTSVIGGTGSAGLVIRGYTGSSSYGALYRVGDTPSDTNPVLISNALSGILNGTTSSSLAVNATNVVVATSAGASVTGTSTVSGLGTFGTSSTINQFYSGTSLQAKSINGTPTDSVVGLWHQATSGNNVFIAFATESSPTIQSTIYYDRTNDGLGISSPLTVTGTLSSTAPFTPGGYTVGTLPAGSTGQICYVTDASAVTAKGTTVAGGGSSKAVLFYNGSNWVGI